MIDDIDDIDYKILKSVVSAIKIAVTIIVGALVLKLLLEVF